MLRPIRIEFFDSLVGQRMRDHLKNDLIGNGGNICTGQSGTDSVLRTANAGGDDLGVNAVEAEDVGDLLDEIRAVVRNVVQPSDERADIAGACSCGQECLRGAEDQRHIGLDAKRGQLRGGLQTLGTNRDLNDDVGMDFDQFLGLGYHALGHRGDYLGADGAVHDAGDLGDHILKFLALLSDERRVGRHAAEDAQGGGTFDLFNVCGVDKDFHRILLCFCIMLFT